MFTSLLLPERGEEQMTPFMDESTRAAGHMRAARPRSCFHQIGRKSHGAPRPHQSHPSTHVAVKTRLPRPVRALRPPRRRIRRLGSRTDQEEGGAQGTRRLHVPGMQAGASAAASGTPTCSTSSASSTSSTSSGGGGGGAAAAAAATGGGGAAAACQSPAAAAATHAAGRIAGRIECRPGCARGGPPPPALSAGGGAAAL